MRFPGCLLAVIMTALCMPAPGEAQAPVSVEFILHAPGLAAHSEVYLSGGSPALGDWKPDAVRMTPQGGDSWRALVIFRQPMSVEYRYTLGADTQLAADDRGQPLPSFSIQARRQLVVSDQVMNWTDENTVVESRGQVTGELRYHRHVRNAQMPGRDLVVWLPRYYDIQTSRDYPVLYLNDGQDLFDPDTAQDGRDWQVDEALQRLIAEDVIEPMIVVGIYSGDDRMATYSPLEEGEVYIDYLVNTVKPLIDRRYRTRPGREHTLVGGAAMGGLIAFASAWTHPEVFGAAMGFSPAFRLDGRFDAIPWFESNAGDRRLPVFFYLDNGGRGADLLLEPGTEAMVDRLQGWGYRAERDFVFLRDMNAAHGARAWGERFPNALTRSLRGASRGEDIANRSRLRDRFSARSATEGSNGEQESGERPGVSAAP